MIIFLHKYVLQSNREQDFELLDKLGYCGCNYKMLLLSNFVMEYSNTQVTKILQFLQLKLTTPSIPSIYPYLSDFVNIPSSVVIKKPQVLPFLLSSFLLLFSIPISFPLLSSSILFYLYSLRVPIFCQNIYIITIY